MDNEADLKAILPIYNYSPAAEEPKPVVPTSKVGQIIEKCSGDGAKASELLPLFVKRNGEPWLRDSISRRFRYDLPRVHGYGVRTISDRDGIDHTYVVYAGSVDAPGMPRHLNTIIYGPPGTGKTYATVRRCVETCDGSAEGSDREIRQRYDALVKADRIEFITFHQSYGYEEFVEGLRPVMASAETDKGTRSARRTDGDARSPESSVAGAGAARGSGFRLVAVPGVLRRIAERARETPHEAHVLVIDEINRANVSKVMGELVTLLEEDKREGADNEVAVTLPHSGERFALPSNLHILGTMNTADRSIALLDTALRRRFEFEELAPDPDALQDAKEATDISLPAVLRAMNERLEWLIDRDHLIGHAWLIEARNRDDVDRVMRRKIIPLIAEYFYDDWEKVRAVLGGTDDFVEGQPLEPPPGLDDTAENRQRWTVRPEFNKGAYTRLVAGSSAPSADAGDTE